MDTSLICGMLSLLCVFEDIFSVSLVNGPFLVTRRQAAFMYKNSHSVS